VEETLNDMPDVEADALCVTQRYENNKNGYKPIGSYERQFHTKTGPATLMMPKLLNQT
jgi:hypothetical protein